MGNPLTPGTVLEAAMAVEAMAVVGAVAVEVAAVAGTDGDRPGPENWMRK